MPNIPLVLACAGYPRVMPLALGEVRAKGIDLTLQVSERGTWTGRAEMLKRALDDPGVHGGEQSIAGQLIRIDRGDRSHVALPVFPLRNFCARDLYVRKDSDIRRPEDLAGRQIGMYGWANSGSVWYRHLLEFLGVDLKTIQWWIGPVDAPAGPDIGSTLPELVYAAPPGRSLSDMLLDDELDAIFSPPKPRLYDPVNGPFIRLFPDFRSVEQNYFRATGAFPPQHLIVLRREQWEANRWIARSLTEAFIDCNNAFEATQRGFPYSTPWQVAELEEEDSLLGPDAYANGVEQNRTQMEMFCDMAHRANLTKRRISTEEYFEEFLSS